MTYQEAATWLLSRDQFLILTHVRPDGDTIGCAAALCRGLRQQGKTAYILHNPEATKLFLPYLEGLIAPEDYQPQTVVAVDMAAVGLFPDNAKIYLERGVDLAIDHHPSQEYYAKETCLYADRAACGEILYDIIKAWGEITPDVAVPLYVAISTDTGCFVYGNTSGDSHRVAGELLDIGIGHRQLNHKHFRTKSFKRLKLESLLTAGLELHDEGSLAIASLTLDMVEAVQAEEEDMEDISSFVGCIQGVTTAITLRELKPGVCKFSLRTNPDVLNASHVCALLGGGGHAAASGATVEGTPAEARAKMMDAIRRIQHG